MLLKNDNKTNENKKIGIRLGADYLYKEYLTCVS